MALTARFEYFSGKLLFTDRHPTKRAHITRVYIDRPDLAADTGA
jgi:hypothetical protein